MSEDTRPICPWRLDAEGFTSDVGEPPGGCRLPPGFKGWVFREAPPETTTAWQEPPPRAKLVPRKAVKAAHREVPMSFPVSNPVAAVAPADDAPAASPAALTASVGVPAVPSADDLSRIAAQAGGGATGIVMALVAVVGGGGAVWKYLQSKQKASAKKDELAHEQRMKELELQADNQKRDDDKHGECESKRAALGAKVESAESQLRLAEQALSNLRDQVAALSGKIDSSNETTDDYTSVLSKRITKLETAVKAKKKEDK
jgi:hypothetical protein